MTTLRMSNSIEEIQSVLAKVKDDMSRARAKDTGGVDGRSHPLCILLVYW